MNIVVINGSPAGQRGTSAQYTSYLQKRFPQHSFSAEEVAKKIHRIEQDPARIDAIVAP